MTHDYHIPVLAQESVELLNINPDGCYVDLTFGGGGHSRLILSHLSKAGRLVAFDQDADVRANLPDDDRLTFVESNFRFMRGQLRALGIESVDGILADLGVSSHHFDSAERGFSFNVDSPIDMRMNRRATFSARELLASYPSEKLQDIFSRYGELDTTYKIANCIERARNQKPIETVGELLAAVEPCTPKGDRQRFLARLFQALRIEVNGEMEALSMALEQSGKMLGSGGRLVVISYHSLEDRPVKNYMRTGNVEGRVVKDFYGRIECPFTPITRKAVVPDSAEQERNPRSRSAKLRAVAKI